MTIPMEVIEAAQKAEDKYGVPSSVSIAQWALESGYGKHMPANSNNPFGIKAVAGQPFVAAMTREVVHGTEIHIQQKFRKFANLDEAFDLHALLLAHGKPYQKINQWLNNPLVYVQKLTGIYATDPKYGELLTAIIKSQDLLQYDKKATG